MRREAKEAQWREQHAMHHATYRLVQKTSTLENLKAQYSQTLDHDLCSPEIANRIEQRVQALEQLERKNHALVVQDYGLSQQARDVARSWGMDVHEFQHFTGNMVQQQLHSELVSLANNVGDVTQRMREVGIDSKQVESLIGSYAKTAHEYNKTVQHIDKAFAASDICWGLVDYCHAAVQGVGDGVYNVAQVIVHPVEAVTGMAHGAWMIADGLVRLEALGDLYEFDEKLAQKQADSYIEKISATLDAVREQAAQLNTRDAIRVGTAFATEFYLSGKVFSATERLFDVAQHKAIQLSEKIGKSVTQESVLLRTTEGLEVKLGGDVAEQLSKMAGEHVDKVRFTENATHQLTSHHENIEKHLPKALPLIGGYLAYAENQRQDNVTHGQDGAVQDIVQLQELSNNMPAGQESGFVQMPMPDPNDPEHKKSIHEHLQVLEQSQELKELNRITGELEKKLDDTQIRAKIRNDIGANEYFELEGKAKIIYDQYRAITIDVDKIANNTGIPREIIQRIKNHVFYEDHILNDGECYFFKPFDPNIDMAEAWQRLVDGSFKRADLMMLKHEYAESLITRGAQVPYEEAHRFIDDIYSWNKLLIR